MDPGKKATGGFVFGERRKQLRAQYSNAAIPGSAASVDGPCKGLVHADKVTMRV